MIRFGPKSEFLELSLFLSMIGGIVLGMEARTNAVLHRRRVLKADIGVISTRPPGLEVRGFQS